MVNYLTIIVKIIHNIVIEMCLRLCVGTLIDRGIM